MQRAQLLGLAAAIALTAAAVTAARAEDPTLTAPAPMRQAVAER